MEEQGAMARHANSAAGGNIDDENSQAEGSNVEGAVGYSRNDAHINLNNNVNNNASQQQLQQNHPHYENIYESLEQYNAAAAAAAAAPPAAGAGAGVNAVAPADELPQADVNAIQPNINNLNNVNNNQQRILPNISYRNDLYDRTNTTSPAYDVPRAVRSGLGFRRNFHIDLQGANRFNPSRATAANAAPLYGSNNNCQRQRSFDDTESHNYYNFNYQPSMRYENIYEQIRDEPIYRNTGSGARVYGRLDVIGHGIGRIERHLSSSCGNIDHYNLGGHYAVLGHSQFGTVGHIRLNTSASVANAPVINGACTATPPVANSPSATANIITTGNQKDASNVKNSASSFFSCLQGENAQSMSNIYRASVGIGSGMATTSAAAAGQQIPMQFNGVLPNNAREREPRSASAGPLTMSCSSNNNSGNGSGSIDLAASSSSNRQTGAIPKIKGLNSNKTGASNSATNAAAEKALSIKNAITKKAAANSSTSQQAATTKASTTSSETLPILAP
ncbi:PREDICTED: ring canal kelch protein-like [Rhagoletis zephyria]|uniref:ring canal kelch protein-like n=1 Tax=Rhagoletis zephyria TaxID=28612 RepID=UPI00081120FB|nr:PREDICTED: ring canal kelch protein-like [Rhagoletis zephyria]